MRKLVLGDSDVTVSEICLGTMTYSRHTPAEDAFAQMDHALDVGISFFDCAEAYPVPTRSGTVGNSEKVIGDWLRKTGKRHQVQIATKVSGFSRHVRDGEGYDGKIIQRTVESSLRRLGVEVIDLYQLHTPLRGGYAFRQNWDYDPSLISPIDTLAHMEDVVATMGALIQQGKIRAFGVSNETAWGLLRWLDAGKRVAGARVATIQNEYSLLDRQFDTDLAEAVFCENVVLLGYSPLAAGMLTGKYQDGETPADSRVAIAAAMGEAPTLGNRRTMRAESATDAYHQLAEDEGLDPIHMAIAFARQRPFTNIPIIGATTLQQLQHITVGLDLRLTDDQLAQIDDINYHYPMPY